MTVASSPDTVQVPPKGPPVASPAAAPAARRLTLLKVRTTALDWFAAHHPDARAEMERVLHAHAEAAAARDAA